MKRPLAKFLLAEQLIGFAIIDHHPGATDEMTGAMIKNGAVVTKILKKSARRINDIVIVKVQDAPDMRGKILGRPIPHGISVQNSATSENTGNAGNAPARVAASEPH